MYGLLRQNTAETASGSQSKPQTTPTIQNAANQESSKIATQQIFPIPSGQRYSLNGGEGYTFLTAFVGDYCNGCYDGLSLPSGIEIATVSGGHDSAEADGEGWLIITAKFPEGAQLSEDEWGYPTGPFVERLKASEKGETVSFDQSRFTFVDEVMLDGKPARVFSARVSDRGSQTARDLLMFTKGAKAVLLGVETIRTRYQWLFQGIKKR